MFRLAAQMAGHRVSAMVALGCAVLGGAALVTGTGVLAESGLRSHLPAGRLAGADVVVAADQEFHPSGDLPIALPERRTVPARLVTALGRLPGVTAAVGDLAFPAALLDGHGHLTVPDGDPHETGHGWSSTRLLSGTPPRMDGRAPAASADVAVDEATAAAARVHGGDPVHILAAGHPAATYRVTAVLHTSTSGLFFADPTATRLASDARAAANAPTRPSDSASAARAGSARAAADVSSGVHTPAQQSGSLAAAPVGSGHLAAPAVADTSWGDRASARAGGSRAVTTAGWARSAADLASGVPAVAHNARAGAGRSDASGGRTTTAGGRSDASGARTTTAGAGRADAVDLIGLRTAPGARDRVAAEVRAELKGSGLVAVTGGGRGDLASPGAGAGRSLLVLLAGSLAGVVLLITGFVVAGALAVSLAGQRRDLALMRAVGATPRQIRRLAATQSTVVAAVALAPGAALGYLLAGQFRQLLAGRGVIPHELPLTLSPLPFLATVVLIGLAVQVAARAAAWRTSRMPATEAVAESRSEPRVPSRTRTRAGLLVVAAATATSALPLFSRTVLGATATSIAGILGAIGLALAGPALVRWIGDAAARRTRTGGSAPTWLAMANVRAYALRNAGTVSALAMAVVFVLTYTLTQTTVLAATARDVRTGTSAQQRLTAPDLGGLPDGTLAAVRGAAGVRAAAPVGSTTVVWSYRMFGDTESDAAQAMILTPDAPGVLDLGVREGSLSRLTGATVAVSGDVARSRGARLGSSVHLVLGDGTPVDARVVAVYGRGLGFGDVVLSRDLAAGHTTSGLDQSILIRTDDGTGAAGATDAGTGSGSGSDSGGTGPARTSLAALVAAHPGLRLEATRTDGAGGLKDAPPEVWINLVTIVVLLVYLLLSIANKLVAATSQRRVEMGALRLNGTTPRQVRAMMRREAAVTAATALVVALLLSAVPLALLGQSFLGRPWPAGPGWLLPALAALVTATAFLTTEIPTRRALRTPPADAVRAL